MICRIEKLDVKLNIGLSILVGGSIPKMGIELGYNALFGRKLGFAGLSQKDCTASKLTRTFTGFRGLRAGIRAILVDSRVSQLVSSFHP